MTQRNSCTFSLLNVLFLGLALSAFCILPVRAEYHRPASPKLIHDGWMFQESCSSTDWLRKNIAMLEQVIPGHGLAIRFKVPGHLCGNRQIETTRLFGGPRWEYSWFSHDIENLKKTAFRKFTDNFLSLAVNPGNVDWFSDAEWDIVCNNHRIATRIARETGMVGLKLDIEEYHNNSMWQFKKNSGKSLTETQRQVRKRGREFGQAIFTEFPDIKLLCYWWLSLARHKNDRFHPESAAYLVAPFVNGIYDVLPATAVIHEGDENFSYKADSMEEFYHLRVDLDLVLPRFLDSRHLEKYRQQTRLAPGIYIDPHFSTRRNYWQNALQPTLQELGGRRLFLRNLQQAREVADEYIWMWGERFSWFPCSHPAKPVLMDKVSPGIAAEMDLVLNAEKYAPMVLKKKKPAELIKNGDFSRQPEGRQALTCFGEWQGGKGKFQRAVLNGNPVAAAIGVENGCIYQSLKVLSGQMYLVRGSMRSSNDSAQPIAAVNWKRKNGERYPDFNRRICRFPNAVRDQWNSFEFIVTVPEHAFYLEVMLSVENGQNAAPVYFDNLSVLRLLD